MSSDQGRDDSDGVRVFVENDEVSVRLLFNDQPVLRGEPRLTEPDLLLPGRFFAASQQNRLLASFVFYEGVL